jgi:glycosyltransferase involved in cell wall biosynthesis
MARVSAIIPVFNGAATITEAVDSALAQTYGEIELIIVDDGSTDATRDLLRRYGDRIKIIDRSGPQEHRGSGPARNAGCAVATGEYLAFLDADDTWRPEMVARTVAALDAEPDCVLAYCNLALMDSAGRELGASLLGTGFERSPTLDDLLSRAWPIMPSSLVVRRAVYDAVGGFAEELGTAYDDIYFCLMARERGRFHYIPEQLGTWRFSLFPQRLKAGKRGGSPRRAFERLVHDHFGVAADNLIRSRSRAPRSILGYIGLMALQRGDRVTARQAFIRALELDRYRLKNYFRLMKTFLPLTWVRWLSGRTRGRRQSLSDRRVER